MKQQKDNIADGMFEKDDLSQRYGSHRVRYPLDFLKMLLKNHCRGNELALDLATGTGFLAHLLSFEFKQVKAVDLSSTQIKVAKELFNSENLEFMVENAYNAPDIITKLNLTSPDLITLAQSLHYFEQEKIYQVVSQAMNENSVLMLIAYSGTLLVNDGENYTQLVSKQVPGYEIHNACLTSNQMNYTDIQFYKEVNDALRYYWSEIFKCVYCVVPDASNFVDRYYQDVVLPDKYLKEVKRYLWFTMEKKTSEEIIKMASTYSCYGVYLAEFEIQQGSKEDPLEKLKNVVLQKGPKCEFDLIIPYYCVVAQKAP